jgi:hypothetical protein
MHITTNVVSSNPALGDVYSIQHYVIKFVSDLRQVGGFLRLLRFPPTTLVVICIDCIGSCKFNYHTITTTTASVFLSVVSYFFLSASAILT